MLGLGRTVREWKGGGGVEGRECVCVCLMEERHKALNIALSYKALEENTYTL